MYSSIYTMASVPQAKDGDSSNIRNQIKTEIRRRVQWLSNDCSTFWRVRLEKTEWYDDNKTDDNKTSDNGLGAGNLVMALAMLSACNFLAKAYSLLVKPDAFVTEEDTAKVKGAVSKVIEAFPDFKHLLTNSKTGWRPQPKGSCNETDAFVRLIQALHNDDINLGLPSDQAPAWVARDPTTRAGAISARGTPTA